MKIKRMHSEKFVKVLTKKHQLFINGQLMRGKTSDFGICLAAYSAKVLHRLPVFVFPRSNFDENVHFMTDTIVESIWNQSI